MKYIRNFKGWKALHENKYAELNGISTATDIHGGSLDQPTNPRTSMDAHDRFSNYSQQQHSQLVSMLHQIFPNANIDSSSLELDLKELTIQRIYKKENGGIDIYIEYKLDEEYAHGVFYNWGGDTYQIRFKTTLFDNFNLNYIFKRKLEGILKKTLQKWFIPEEGEYTLLKDELPVWDEYGNKPVLKKGNKIKVVKITRKDLKPNIHIIHNDKNYWITDEDYYFFKYWFVPVKKHSENNL